MTEGVVTVREGREKPVRQGHPWVFSGAIAKAQGAAPGDVVTLNAHDGAFLARGYWNPKSQIQVRVLTWQDEAVDEGWWRRMLARGRRCRGGQRLCWFGSPCWAGCWPVSAVGAHSHAARAAETPGPPGPGVFLFIPRKPAVTAPKFDPRI